jgi:threonine dehydrogenase-like Zn-dependent dehydrogenase
MRLESDRPMVLRELLRSCRNGGTVSIPGVYGGFIDKLPMGSVMNRALTLKTGQTHVQRYLQPLLERVRRGDFHPERLVTHRLPLDDAPHAYRMFRDKLDGCVKVVLKPWLH